MRVFEDRFQYKVMKIVERKYSDIEQIDARFGKYIWGKNGIEESVLLIIKFKNSIFAFSCIFWRKENGIEVLKFFKRKGLLLSDRAKGLFIK